MQQFHFWVNTQNNGEQSLEEGSAQSCSQQPKVAATQVLTEGRTEHNVAHVSNGVLVSLKREALLTPAATRTHPEDTIAE